MTPTVVVSPDKFKGSLTALEVAAAAVELALVTHRHPDHTDRGGVAHTRPVSGSWRPGLRCRRRHTGLRCRRRRTGLSARRRSA